MMMIGENCKIMQWVALLGTISTTFLDNNNNNNDNNNNNNNNNNNDNNSLY